MIFPIPSFILVVLVSSVKGDYIPCPLEWVGMKSGDDYPSNSIPGVTYGNDFYVARVKIGLTYIIGYTNSKFMYSFDGLVSSKVGKHSSYEVLINPSKCVVEWLRGSKDTWADRFLVVPVEDSPFRVGRGLSTIEARILVGEARNLDGLLVALNSTFGTLLEEFELLRSYQKGLSLDVDDIVWQIDESPIAIPSIIGIDQMVNRSPGKITLYKSFTSNFQSYLSVKNKASSWGHVKEMQFSISQATAKGESSGDVGKFKLPDLSFSGLSYPLENPQDPFEDDKKEFIEVNATITLLPFNEIQLCTFTDIVDDFTSDFVATGRYFAPGLSGEEVALILEKDGITGDIEEKAVIVQITGVFSGSYFSETQILSAPLALVGPGSCYFASNESTFLRNHYDNGIIDKKDLQIQIQRLKDSLLSMNFY